MYRFIVKFGVLCVFYILCFSSRGIIAQIEQDTSFYVGDVDPGTAYCFRFTWLGPKWDNTSEINGTCESIKHVPCKEPLVITHNSAPPNTTYMWYNYDLSQIACRLTRGEVCTKWVQYYGEEIEFITYMCSKYTVQGVAKVNWDGCEKDTASSNKTFINEVCACRSAEGVKPCNSAVQSKPPKLTLLVGLLAVISVLALAHTTS